LYYLFAGNGTYSLFLLSNIMPMKITVVASSNTDMIIKTPWLPPGETVLGELLLLPLGKGANQRWLQQESVEVTLLAVSVMTLVNRLKRIAGGRHYY
jgi:hypothetical protein